MVGTIRTDKGLSGPLSPQQTSALNILNVTTQYIGTDSSDLQRFWDIESTGTSSVIDSNSDKTFFSLMLTLVSHTNQMAHTLLDFYGRSITLLYQQTVKYVKGRHTP